MAKLTYAEQLLDPRWQRLRLKVLEACGWQCQNCGDETTQFHVHHKRYKKGAMAWEYEPDELEALCKDCHKQHHDFEARLKAALAALEPDDLERVMGYAKARYALRMDMEGSPIKALSDLSFEQCEGIADAYRVNAMDCVDLAQDNGIQIEMLNALERATRKGQG